MRYLVTGHTGFKGAWLSLWLAELGHEVVGLALDPLPGGLYEAARVPELIARDVRMDIRDADRVAALVRESQPEVVIHLAAQPLVRESYRDPVTTFTTNVDGTLNLLAGIRGAASVRAALVVTTDKVYRNDGRRAGYREADPLGGEDPYSASKAMADLLTQSWAASFPGPPTAIARAGNVIGAGDVAPDRLLPDLIGAYLADRVPELRYPGAVRPWQHVLDCLNGYLTIVEALLAGRGAGAWNLGPDPAQLVRVAEVADRVADGLGRPRGFTTADGQPHEAGMLLLDSAKAQSELGWQPRLPFDHAIDWALEFAVHPEGDPRALATEQLRAFTAAG